MLNMHRDLVASGSSEMLHRGHPDNSDLLDLKHKKTTIFETAQELP